MAPTLFASDALAGRIALVTGASSGLGLHFAQLLAAHGAAVVLAARRLPELEGLAAGIAASGGRAHAVPLDVRDDHSVALAFDAATAAFGTPDIVVNNAGIALTRYAVKTADDDWNAVIDTNLSGAFRVAREAARRLQAERRRGAIVNIASILGLRVAKALPAYIAAKAGLIRLTEALALEFAASGIRVNALAPGYVETELNRDFLRSPAGATIGQRIPLGRFGTPADLDGALLLLASDAGAYMTGATLTVDGGHAVTWL